MIVTNLISNLERERERAESNWKLFCGTGVIYFNLLEMDFSNRIEASGTTCYLENMSETTQGKQAEAKI